MPIIQNIGSRFQWTQPCFACISVHTSAKIMTIIDFTWAVLGFFSTFFYGLYWYDLADIEIAHTKDNHDPLKLVLHGSDLYYYQPMHVSGLMALILIFGGAIFLTYAVFHQLQIGGNVCVPNKSWLAIFGMAVVIRPFAFLLFISLLHADYTETLFAIAGAISVFYTIYGIWIILSCKKKLVTPRPLIVYEGVN